MNTIKTSNPVRLIAFFLTAAILTLTFGFTVDGWTLKSEEVGSNQNSENKDDNSQDGDTILDNSSDDEATIEPEPIIPEFINRLTGLETTEAISKTTPLAFIMEGFDGLYGISRSDLLIEIPIENEDTRLISFISDTKDLWKIGSITSGRGYINNLTKYFGGISVYNGIDDKIKYDFCDIGKNSLDLSMKEGYHYTEFSDKAYTNCELITTAKSAYGISGIQPDEMTLPFVFNQFGNECIKFEKNAIKIEVKKAEGASLQLTYNKENGKYTCYQNGKTRIDPLNGKMLDFKNCFILFADSVTYDNSDGCQLVMNTVGSGVGYYITEGSYTEIKWSSTLSGVMSFYLTTGEKLTINRGNSYICYFKSSRINNISFS